MKTRTFFVPLSLLFVFFITINSQAQTAIQGQTYEVIPATVNRTGILQLVNEARKKGCQCGDTYYYPAPPVVWNIQLETSAYRHTVDMAKNKFFSHTAPDGSRGNTRLERAGYNWKTYGENIGEGYRTEKEMLKGWLASPGHCKNIMNKAYKDMGVARVGNLWTQEFGSK